MQRTRNWDRYLRRLGDTFSGDLTFLTGIAALGLITAVLFAMGIF